VGLEERAGTHPPSICNHARRVTETSDQRRLSTSVAAADAAGSPAVPRAARGVGIKSAGSSVAVSLLTAATTDASWGTASSPAETSAGSLKDPVMSAGPSPRSPAPLPPPRPQLSPLPLRLLSTLPLPSRSPLPPLLPLPRGPAGDEAVLN
jgi:hypothetical protein